MRQALQDRAQVTLCELVRQQPLQQGLAELVAYLQLGDDTFKVAVDESVDERVDWQGVGADGQACLRQARLPRVIFVR